MFFVRERPGRAHGAVTEGRAEADAGVRRQRELVTRQLVDDGPLVAFGSERGCDEFGDRVGERAVERAPVDATGERAGPALVPESVRVPDRPGGVLWLLAAHRCRLSHLASPVGGSEDPAAVADRTRPTSRQHRWAPYRFFYRLAALGAR